MLLMLDAFNVGCIHYCMSTGTIFSFNISIEKLADIFRTIDSTSSSGKDVLEAMNVICNSDTVKGMSSPFCIDLIFANFPSNLVVEGCTTNKVSYWNNIGEMLYDSTF